MRRNKIIKISKNILNSLLVALTIFVIAIIAISFNTNRVQDRNFLGTRFFIVLSDSMKPEFQAGDLIISKTTAPEKLGVGDNITFFNRSGDVITHQIHELKVIDGQSVFVTKGINNESIDEEYVYNSQIIGKYTFSIPKLGIVINFLKSTWGYILFIATPLLYICIKNSLKIIKLTKEAKKEKDFKREQEIAALEAEKEKYKQMEQELESLKSKLITGNNI